MIDWGKVGAHSLWLVGLSLVLAASSIWDYRRRTAGRLLRASWGSLARSTWVRLGGLLVCAGMGLTSSSWLEALLWGVLGLYTAYGLIGAWRAMGHRAPVHASAVGGEEDESSASRAPVSAGALARLSRSIRIRRGSLPDRLAAWVMQTETLWLALLSPFFLFPAPERAFFLLALPTLWIIRRVASGHFVPPTPLDWSIALLLVMVLVSLYATFDINFSLGKIAGLLFGVALFYAVVQWASTPTRLGWAVGGYTLAGAGLAAVGLLGTQWAGKFAFLDQLVKQLPPALRGLPGAEEGINPNQTGGALLWVLPVQMALAGWTWSGGLSVGRAHWLQRFGLVLLTAVSGGTLLLTQSRGALISLVVALLLLLWLARSWGKWLLLGLVLAGAAVVLYVGPEEAGRRLASASNLESVTVGGAQSVAGRAEIWSRAIYGIEDFPFTGMGMNAFRRVMPILYPLFSVSPDQDLAHAHNHFLQVALDLGLAGLVAYMAIFALAATMVVQTWRAAGRGWVRALSAGIGAGLLAYFVYGVTDTVALGAKPGVFFWGLLALLASAWRQFALNVPEKSTPKVSWATEDDRGDKTKE